MKDLILSLRTSLASIEPLKSVVEDFGQLDIQSLRFPAALIRYDEADWQDIGANRISTVRITTSIALQLPAGKVPPRDNDAQKANNIHTIVDQVVTLLDHMRHGDIKLNHTIRPDALRVIEISSTCTITRPRTTTEQLRVRRPPINLFTETRPPDTFDTTFDRTFR